MYDESFEQSISDKRLSKDSALDNISLGWSNLSGPVLPRWIDDPRAAFNGNVSVELELSSSSAPLLRNTTTTSVAPLQRVGVAARGLYHQGFYLRQGRPYEGYVAVKASKPSTVHVRLEDWGDDPSGAAGGTTLAHRALVHPGDGGWHVLNFTLTPTAATSCTPYPVGKAPLSCGIPNSQAAFPPSATGTCVVCGGTLTVALEEPGPAVSIDQVFLEPGAWGRYQGLHVHRAAAEWVLAMGTRMLRYGGTFTNTVQVRTLWGLRCLRCLRICLPHAHSVLPPPLELVLRVLMC